ncbi:Glu/Leu/Phe/Val dehydrogenase dimerization domain-containing protein [Actinoplanes xinjiangensis]|uniref:Leucine dehydrogenase n=1 Tax=Actinoplanes xinjiangensis TaxID=512350 RepID=A0A316FD88_9ACTN|nr:Glu/Leu/Phe/Val dehydrogenase dimerization domain-containing protein [Actinoplanes xinjiangensis]PWK45144.1 leucine dehydrogenase [Actinoplanes xinjiangensis]GIF41521.1 leucine dehydrogenase [Actinoplanes xinjiangensis]
MDRTQLGHEEVRAVRGVRTGVTVIVAVHSTARGPAIGGVRIKPYPSWRDGLDDVLRLSEAMTMKCALADLAHGGGKTVAVLPPDGVDPRRRTDLITDIAEAIDGFDGRYRCGPDIGSTPDDMSLIHRLARGNAFCRPEAEGGSGNSSAATARGVIAALRAGLRHRHGDDRVSGRRIGVIGYGHVGRLVAGELIRSGATVLITDVDSRLAGQAEAGGARWTTADLLTEELDVLVPAATGGLLTDRAARTCRAGLIVGPANNQLADDRAGVVLHERGITWVPDVLASIGGIVHAVSREETGLDDTATAARVDRIGEKTTALLAHAAEHRITPLAAARRMAAA